jgi:hypothetical protein
MFLDLRILNELRAHFVEVRILQGLRLQGVQGGGRRGTEKGGESFELIFEITRRSITLW